MLRLIVLLLILLNAGFYVYVQGYMAAFGFAPAVQTEPHRVNQQIRPEAMRVIGLNKAGQLPIASPPAQGNANVSASTGPTECLQVGVFNEEQTFVLRERVASVLPQGSWVIENATEPGRWLVYMGKYSNDEAVARKKSELRGLGVVFEVLGNPALAPGLQLGNFATQADAKQALALIARKGVKTAKVIEDRAEQRGQRLRLAAVDAGLRSQLDGIQPVLAGKAFRPCA